MEVDSLQVHLEVGLSLLNRVSIIISISGVFLVVFADMVYKLIDLCG